MITRGLEEIIQQGKGAYRTFSFGGSGVATIPVPVNGFIIITDFDYWHFVDPNPTASCGTLTFGNWEDGDEATFCIQQTGEVIGTVLWQGTAIATAQAFANDVNTNHSPMFSATVTGATVTICADPNLGSAPNGWIIQLCNFLAQENLDLILQEDTSKIIVT